MSIYLSIGWRVFLVPLRAVLCYPQLPSLAAASAMLFVPHHAACGLPHPARRHLLQPAGPKDGSSRLSALSNGPLHRHALVSKFWYGGAQPFNAQYDMRRTMAFALANETEKEEEPTCAACEGTPRHDKVDRVSLLIPFYEPELCKIKYTLRSLRQQLPDFFSHVHLAWVSPQSVDDYHGLPVVMELAESIATTTLHDASGFLQQNAESSSAGWMVQQVVKLLIARHVTKDDFYLVLDAKNAFTHPPQAHEFFNSCNQARLTAPMLLSQMPSNHAGWYQASANVLGITDDISEWDMPLSITPALFHTRTVLHLIERVQRSIDLGDRKSYLLARFPSLSALLAGNASKLRRNVTLSQLGEVHDVRRWEITDQDVALLHAVAQRNATEFTMYNLFALHQAPPEQQCAHTVSSDRVLGFEVWRGQSLDAMRAYAAKFGPDADVKMKAAMAFGVQRGALGQAVEEGQASEQEVQSLLQAVFDGAGLLRGGEDLEQLMHCIDGGKADWELPQAFVFDSQESEAPVLNTSLSDSTTNVSTRSPPTSLGDPTTSENTTLRSKPSAKGQPPPPARSGVLGA